MTPDPAVELNEKLGETSRFGGARGVITADTENSSHAAHPKSTCEGGHEMAANHLGTFTDANPHNPAGSLHIAAMSH